MDKDVMTAFVFENGEQTNVNFYVPYKNYVVGEMIDFHGDKFKVISNQNVVIFVEEI
jgi:hypothetical protein